MFKKIKSSMFSKFVLSFLLIIILFISAALLDNYYTSRVLEMEEEVMEMQDLQLKLTNLEIDHHLWMLSLYDMMIGGPVPKLGDHTECNLGKWYYNTTPELYFQQPYQDLEEAHTHLHKHGHEVIELFNAGAKLEARNLFNEEIKPDLNSVRRSLGEIISLTEAEIEKLKIEKNEMIKFSNLVFYSSTIITLLLAAFIAWLLTKTTVGPINKLVDLADKAAAGDLKNTIETKKTDEIGVLINSFNNMIKTLSKLVKSIEDNSDAVVTSVKDLNVVSEHTGRGSEDIASSITEVAEGSENIGLEISTVKEVAVQLEQGGKALKTNTRESLELADESSLSAEKGKEAIQKAISQLDVVSETVNFATEAIEKLGKRSKEIGDMVVMIEGISSQTNLLALNAAIEAARAGDKGRGFSVVAEEVRELAEESSDVTTKINSLIEDIQSETTATINSMDTNIEEVNKQIEIISQAGESLNTMVSASDKTDNKVKEIDEFAEELDQMIAKINNSVNSVSSAIENNAASAEEVSALAQEQSATVEEISASADELENMANHLQSLVNKFEV